MSKVNDRFGDRSSAAQAFAQAQAAIESKSATQKKKSYATMLEERAILLDLLRSNLDRFRLTTKQVEMFRMRSKAYKKCFNRLTRLLQQYIGYSLASESCDDTLWEIKSILSKSVITEIIPNQSKYTDGQKHVQVRLVEEYKRGFNEIEEFFFDYNDFESAIDALRELFCGREEPPETHAIIAAAMSAGIYIKFFKDFEQTPDMEFFELVSSERDVKKIPRLPGLFIKDDDGQFRLYNDCRGREPESLPKQTEM